MKTSELIKELQISLKENGDLDVRLADHGVELPLLEGVYPLDDRGYVLLEGWRIWCK